MRYLLMIVSDGQPTEAKAAANATGLPAWLEATAQTRRYGERLADVDTAVTVRTRGGQVFTSDGPFAESKEWMAGFDIIDCDDLDAAIEIAAQHPVAAFHAVEIRPFLQDEWMESAVPELPSDGRLEQAPEGRQRYLMLMCMGAFPEDPDELAALGPNCVRWGDAVAEAGDYLYGFALQGPEAATTVRVRDGETVLSDGPFVDAKEFICGFVIADCERPEQAVSYAAGHPLAHYARVEVRPFWEGDHER